MIVNKVTNGFVIQQYDTETEKFISQEFIAGDEVDFENEEGMPVSEKISNKIPYLQFNMVQPE